MEHEIESGTPCGRPFRRLRSPFRGGCPGLREAPGIMSAVTSFYVQDGPDRYLSQPTTAGPWGPEQPARRTSRRAAHPGRRAAGQGRGAGRRPAHHGAARAGAGRTAAGRRRGRPPRPHGRDVPGRAVRRGGRPGLRARGRLAASRPPPTGPTSPPRRCRTGRRTAAPGTCRRAGPAATWTRWSGAGSSGRSASRAPARCGCVPWSTWSRASR